MLYVATCVSGLHRSLELFLLKNWWCNPVEFNNTLIISSDVLPKKISTCRPYMTVKRASTSQHDGFHDCMQGIYRWENDSNVQFDIVIRQRTDVYAPLPTLSILLTIHNTLNSIAVPHITCQHHEHGLHDIFAVMTRNVALSYFSPWRSLNNSMNYAEMRLLHAMPDGVHIYTGMLASIIRVETSKLKSWEKNCCTPDNISRLAGFHQPWKKRITLANDLFRPCA
jgi:hypothetical protein